MMQRLRGAISGGLVVAMLAMSAQSVFAQSDSQKLAAQALYDAAKKLMGEKKYGEACPKFAESQKLDPGVGTLLNLADCYEKLGKLASAWLTFKETAAAAKSAGQADREKYARDKVKTLDSKIAKLTISVPAKNQVDGLEVKRDGVVVDKVTWDTPIAIDPGSHLIEASAPGKKKWTTTLEVPKTAAQPSITVPALEVDPSGGKVAPIETKPVETKPIETKPVETVPSETKPVETKPPVDEGPKSGGSSQKTIGMIVGGVGIVGIAFGAIFGLRAKSKNDEAASHCRPENPKLCDADGVSLGDDAKSAATLSTVAFVVGGAAIAGGIILYVTAPKETTSGRIGLTVAGRPGSLGLSLTGAF